MTATEDDWSRPQWSRDAAKALLLYFVFGEFAERPRLDLSAHGSRGLPGGVEMLRIPQDRLAQWQGHPLRGALGGILREGDPAAFEAAQGAPECLMLRGELADSGSLEYLRDTLGVVSALLDAGARAVVDPQILEIFPPGTWRARYAGAERSVPRKHVAILCDGPAGRGATQWIHTRGMRKFARPDISIRRVPPAEVQPAGALVARLVDLQARGLRFGDGSIIDVEGLRDGLTVTRAGSLEDPAFNNVHLELTWPSA